MDLKHHRKELREIERDLVELCRKHSITLCSGYVLGQPMTIYLDNNPIRFVYEVSPIGVKYDLHESEFHRRFRRK